MDVSRLVYFAIALAAVPGLVSAQDAPERPQITLGNGILNAIEIDGITRESEEPVVSEVRFAGEKSSVMRANSTTVTFPKVMIEKTGWIVLHPVIDGRPNGDIVSGFAYLTAGQNENVAIKMQHPASAGDKYLVMLHNDVDDDRVFDFVFVDDGINVEDTAVFEGSRMIAHMIALPE